MKFSLFNDIGVLSLCYSSSLLLAHLFSIILSLKWKLANGGFRHSFCVCMTLKMPPLVMVFLLIVQDR